MDSPGPPKRGDGSRRPSEFRPYGSPEGIASEEDLERRLQFLELSEDDAERLARISAELEPFVEAYVERFYDHLLQFEETSRFLADPELVARLKQRQCEHFRSMLAGRWDQAFVERRKLVGRRHADVGIEPRFFLGSYLQFLNRCLERLFAHSEPPQLDDLLSLIKTMFLDVGLSLEEYFSQSTKDLRQALDMYWLANNELRQFAHFTSHDLKTPLATVSNLCEEVLDEFGDDIPEEARQLIQSARKTVFRMSSTIDELLTTSIDMNPMGPDDEFHSGDAIHDAIESVRPLLEEQGIVIEQPESYPHVIGNKAHLREVFINLLSNAAKYIDKHPGRIEVSVEQTGTECVFAVSDNGVGIPEGEQVRIFAPFRRLSVHRDKTGSGLGLYFARNLVERQGGRIWVESKVGEGSTFYVKLQHAPDPT